MGNVFLLVAVLLVAASGLSAPAAAAGKKCVSLDKRLGFEALVNSCRSCRIVNLTRSRPGNLPTTQRTYTVPGKSRIDLSFRGPGKTTVLSDIACDGSTPEQLYNLKCVRFHRFDDGSPALFNECPACRAVVVERQNPDGERNRSTYTLNNRAYLPLRTYGARIARIVSDKACK